MQLSSRTMSVQLLLLYKQMGETNVGLTNRAATIYEYHVSLADKYVHIAPLS